MVLGSSLVYQCPQYNCTDVKFDCRACIRLATAVGLLYSFTAFIPFHDRVGSVLSTVSVTLERFFAIVFPLRDVTCIKRWLIPGPILQTSFPQKQKIAKKLLQKDFNSVILTNELASTYKFAPLRFTCSPSNKASTSINYNSRDVLTSKLHTFTTLEASSIIVGAL